MTAPFLVIFTVLVLVAATGLLLQARQVTRTGGLRPSWETPTELEDAYTSGPAPYEVPPSPCKTSTPRGFRPPAHPDLIPMMISAECSSGACGICAGAPCEHDCMHIPSVIVARNAAEYDRTHGKAPA